MSRYYGSWAPHVSVAQRRKQAEREIDRLRKKGQAIAPVIIEGRAIATTFWGKAWCENLECYLDFASRLPRGRSYVRNRAVLDLQIAPREVNALVSGASIYKVKVGITQTPDALWQSMCQDCAGGINSLVDLLLGRISKNVMERLCRQDKGLFPKPSEIKFSCTCPDFADMCKHVAAVLYGVGARLDEAPELLFRLRAVDEGDLLANLDGAAPMSMTGPDVSRILETGDASALFGLEMADAPLRAPAAPPRAKARTRPKPADPKTSGSGQSAAHQIAQRKGAQPKPAKPAAAASAVKAVSHAKAPRKRRKVSGPGRVSSSASAPARPGPGKLGPGKSGPGKPGPGKPALKNPLTGRTQ